MLMQFKKIVQIARCLRSTIGQVFGQVEDFSLFGCITVNFFPIFYIMRIHPSLVQQFDLSGRVALVTGGSGALGRAMAQGLAMANARVALLARRPERLQEAVAAIEQIGGQAFALAGNVLDRCSLEKARETLLHHWGRLDILINRAGGNVREARLSRARESSP